MSVPAAAPLPPPPRLWLGSLTAPLTLSAEERRWGAGLPEARRMTYWASRSRLRSWLAEQLGCAPLAVPLHSPPGRAPRLGDGAGWVSLSHSGDGLLLGYSRQPIGVDLESLHRPLAVEGLIRRFFPPQEVAQLERLPAEERRQAVLCSWVLKEAAIKWQGTALATDLRHWQLDHGSGRLHHGALALAPECRTAQTPSWRWAVVGAGAGRALLELA